MTTEAHTILEWTYEPGDFFEEPTECALRGGAVSIANGTVRGQFSAPEDARSLRERSHSSLFTFFLIQQLATARRFSLSSPSLSVQNPDGTVGRVHFVEVHTLISTSRIYDVVLRDTNGTVIQDSKAARIAAQRTFREHTVKLYETDHVVRRLLQMFHHAQDDAENSFVHLYEIRDCLVHELGNEAVARRALDITKKEWSRFGRLANDEPLFEGRHRGKHLQLRHATSDELAFATSFAKRLIERYVASKTALKT
jgi:hypothetical protein